LHEFHDEWIANEVAMVDFLEEWTDNPLPPKKLDLCVVPKFASGGMENFGLITLSEYSLKIRGPGLRRDLLMHETFHQWQGDLVTPAKWTHIYLNEGFARLVPKFLAQSIFDDDTEINYWKQISFSRLLKVDELPNTPFPILHEIWENDPSELFSPVNYDKAGYVLSMIRDFIGPDSFRDVLRKYYRTYAWQSVVHEDMWRLFNEVRDCSGFVKLLTQRGYPLLILESDGFIHQVPCSLSEDDAEAVWEFPLHMLMKIGSSIVEEVVWIGSEAVSVREDAEWVFMNDSLDMLCRVWHKGRYQSGVIAAGLSGELPKHAWAMALNDMSFLIGLDMFGRIPDEVSRFVRCPECDRSAVELPSFLARFAVRE
jgi:aminopeptidase N